MSAGGLETGSTTTRPEHFGVVGYTHGLGIDRPLNLFKVGGAVVAPHANWRGVYQVGTYMDGTDDTGCVQTSSCVVAWPAPHQRSLYYRMQPHEPFSWFGSLITNKRDGSGQLYMRNRYYDPMTGRFTQEDPIGLAGGLNLYGFADGDPVNLDDPFGLWPEWLDKLIARARAGILRRRLVAAQDDAIADRRFAPGRLGRTYCNQATYCVAQRMGAPMAPLTGDNGQPLLADEMGANLAAPGSGYRSVSADEAQELANQGVLVIVHGSGHVATVRPDNVPGETAPGTTGPVIANVGASNRVARLSRVFRPDDRLRVKYYTPETQ